MMFSSLSCDRNWLFLISWAVMAAAAGAPPWGSAVVLTASFIPPSPAGLTSTLCSHFLELGPASEIFLQELLESFKALSPPPQLFFSLRELLRSAALDLLLFQRTNVSSFVQAHKCSYGCVSAAGELLPEQVCRFSVDPNPPGRTLVGGVR